VAAAAQLLARAASEASSKTTVVRITRIACRMFLRLSSSKVLCPLCREVSTTETCRLKTNLWPARRSVPEKISFNEFRNDGSYRELEVPFLAEHIRMHRHILTLDRQSHGQGANLDHLADI